MNIIKSNSGNQYYIYNFQEDGTSVYYALTDEMKRRIEQENQTADEYYFAMSNSDILKEINKQEIILSISNSNTKYIDANIISDSPVIHFAKDICRNAQEYRIDTETKWIRTYFNNTLKYVFMPL